MPEQEIIMINEALTTIKMTVARIETKIDAQGDTLSDHEARIRELEGKSGKKWDTVIGAIISAVIVGVIGYAIGKLL